ncbi:MAG: hypothetical protein LQ351_006625 [Letrouitia transgressa]|nr:MAG: hypothetical protein LQ351_006625 [Letrouitia transgressa]
MATANLTAFTGGLSLLRPDYVICDGRFGQGLQRAPCEAIVERLNSGSSPIEYEIGPVSRGPHSLPFEQNDGECKITIEVAGPRLPAMYRAPPSGLKALAAKVVNQCINTRRGEGGFGTFEIKNSVNYVINPEIDLEEPFPASTAFLTLSLTDVRSSMPEPGNFNPTIAQTLGDEIRDVIYRYKGEAYRKLAVRNGWFRARASQMRTGGRTTPWWGPGLRDKVQPANESIEEPTASQTATADPSSVVVAF